MSTPYLDYGEPYIVEEPSMRILEEPSTFLRLHYVESGKRRSIQTWRAAAYQLKLWLEFLVALGLDWRIATIDDLKSYRNALRCAISPHSSDRYASATIRNYMLTVIAFYEFAARPAQGWYEGCLSAVEDVKRRLVAMDKDALAHTRKGDPVVQRLAANDLLPRGGRKHTAIRPFTVLEWRRITSVLGPMPTEYTLENNKLCRDRLICELAFWTGLRISELLGLYTHQFRAIIFDKDAPAAYSRVTLRAETTKGQVERSIRIPNWLIEEINVYIEDERSACLVKMCAIDKACNRRSTRTPAQVFLSGQNSNRIGRPLGVRRCQQILEKACYKAKLVSVQRRYDFDSNAGRDTLVAAHCFHDLRHSYATWTYWAESKLGNSEPWKLIQAQLGHKHLQTTIDTYLHYVNIFDGSTLPIDVRQLIGL